MSLKVYRIDKSFFGKINNMFKTPNLPASASLIGAIGSLTKNVNDLLADNVFVLHKEDEISRFKEANGNELSENVYYVRHPKKLKTDILIPSSDFHHYIIREQLSEIISYLRANLSIKSINLSLKKSQGGKVGLSGIVDGLLLNAEAKMALEEDFSVSIDCPRSLKPSEKEKVFCWIDELSQFTAAVDDFAMGSCSITERFDFSFGLSLDVAKQVGLDLSLHKKHELIIEFEAT